MLCLVIMEKQKREKFFFLRKKERKEEEDLKSHIPPLKINKKSLEDSWGGREEGGQVRSG